MSSHIAPSKPTQKWAQNLRQGLVSLHQLEERGWLDASANHNELMAAQAALDIRVPLAFHDGIENGDQSLTKQFIPSAQEASFAPEELEDPIGDETFSPVPGLTHRYPDRVLIKITYQCAVYCRFCFRRHKVSHSEENLSYEALAPAYEYVEKNPQIKEVIFTGGDPLVLTDARLEPHLQRIEKIAHIETIRFHTRIPVALPERITTQLCQRLSALQKLCWIVIHVNSSSELTPTALESVKHLRNAGIPLAAQSVLLKGVNDTPDALERLFRALYRNGVKPYYLHYPDLAKGTHHFRTPLSQALSLLNGLKGQLPGLAIPQLTIDIPGGQGKIVVNSETCRKASECKEKNSSERWLMRSPLSHQWVEVRYPHTEV